MLLLCVQCITPASAQQGNGNYSALCGEVLKLVNEHRAGLGLSALQPNAVVAAAAERHSKNMGTNKVPFGHDGFDERVATIRKQVKPCNAWAENVAYCGDDAKEAVDMWLHSPGHRKNIEGDYNVTGIGISKGNNGSFYFTQIFLNKGK